MKLTPEKSICEKHQKMIVSRDKGTSRRHCAINPEQKYEVRQYKLDGDIVSQQTCCDFLLVNDTLKNVYFIELKGGNVDHAIPQLEAGYRLFRSQLTDCDFYFRIVASKVRTLDLRKTAFRKFLDQWGSHLRYKAEYMEESL